MQWVDVAGCPGSGKSTLCDKYWPRRVDWDGLPAPREWAHFIVIVSRLIDAIEDRATLDLIFDRTLKKASTLHRLPMDVYANTGFAQLGLEIGWRSKSPDSIIEFYERMPVSIGVVFLWADVAVLRARNESRIRNRSEMIEGMERARYFAENTLRTRGVPVLTINTDGPVSDSWKILTGFRGQTNTQV